MQLDAQGNLAVTVQGALGPGPLRAAAAGGPVSRGAQRRDQCRRHDPGRHRPGTGDAPARADSPYPQPRRRRLRRPPGRCQACPAPCRRRRPHRRLPRRRSLRRRTARPSASTRTPERRYAPEHSLARPRRRLRAGRQRRRLGGRSGHRPGRHLRRLRRRRPSARGGRQPPGTHRARAQGRPVQPAGLRQLQHGRDRGRRGGGRLVLGAHGRRVAPGCAGRPSTPAASTAPSGAATARSCCRWPPAPTPHRATWLWWNPTTRRRPCTWPPASPARRSSASSAVTA